nr:unnamed protein product [Callosobruchus chinensis]
MTKNAHEDGESSPLSPNKSPLHVVSNSPRHAKLNLRLQEFQETSMTPANRRPRMGGVATTHLAMLRERVERQRSIQQSRHHTHSLEDVNSEEAEESEDRKNNQDKIDDQLTTLHQDVAALSIEVSSQRHPSPPRNGHPSSCGQFSARSNPNIMAPLPGGTLARSTSHPPEMFCWDAAAAAAPLITSHSPPLYPLRHCVDSETQTDSAGAIRQYVLDNPKVVLEILGLDPEKTLNSIQLKKSHSIPDYSNRCRNYFSNMMTTHHQQADSCLVDLEEKGEDCPFLWNQGDKRIFEPLKGGAKTQNSLLKCRRSNIE